MTDDDRFAISSPKPMNPQSIVYPDAIRAKRRRPTMAPEVLKHRFSGGPVRSQETPRRRRNDEPVEIIG